MKGGLPRLAAALRRWLRDAGTAYSRGYLTFGQPSAGPFDGPELALVKKELQSDSPH